MEHHPSIVETYICSGFLIAEFKSLGAGVLTCEPYPHDRTMIVFFVCCSCHIGQSCAKRRKHTTPVICSVFQSCTRFQHLKLKHYPQFSLYRCGPQSTFEPFVYLVYTCHLTTHVHPCTHQRFDSYCI